MRWICQEMSQHTKLVEVGPRHWNVWILQFLGMRKGHTVCFYQINLQEKSLIGPMTFDISKRIRLLACVSGVKFTSPSNICRPLTMCSLIQAHNTGNSHLRSFSWSSGYRVTEAVGRVRSVVCSQLSEEIRGCSEQFQADRLQLGGVYLLFLGVPQRWQLSGDENFVSAKYSEFKKVVCASR